MKRAKSLHDIHEQLLRMDFKYNYRVVGGVCPFEGLNNPKMELARKAYTNMKRRIAEKLNIPVVTVTDVNGSYDYYDHDQFYANWDVKVVL